MELSKENTMRHKSIGDAYNDELEWLKCYFRTKLSLLIYHETDAPQNRIEGTRFIQLAMHTMSEIDIEYSNVYTGSVITEQLMEDLTYWVENSPVNELFTSDDIKVIEK